jgi:hypothetical protein
MIDDWFGYKSLQDKEAEYVVKGAVENRLRHELEDVERVWFLSDEHGTNFFPMALENDWALKEEWDNGYMIFQMFERKDN